MSGLLFLGTPEAAVPSLKTVFETGDLRLVITMPDRPRGRRGTPQPSPVKQKAVELGVPVLQPGNRAELIEAVRHAGPLDLGVVVAYGRVIPPEAFTAPTRGMVNVHFSLLPRWRGAAPVERAILAGDQITGVSLMAIEEGLDTGGVFARWRTSIGEDETAGELTDRLAVGGAELLAVHMDALRRGELAAVAQDEREVTHAPKIEKDEAKLNWRLPAEELVRRVRAFNPRPGAFGERAGERFKIWRGRVSSEQLEPGELRLDGDRLLAGAGEGSLLLLEVQAAGGRKMPGAAWARGMRDPLGRLA